MKPIRPSLFCAFVIIVLAIVALINFTAQAANFDQVNFSVNIPSDLTSCTAGTSNSTSGTSFKLPQDRDLQIQCTFVAAGTGTSNTVFGFDFTTDGTTYTTTHPVTVTLSANGTTSVSGVGTINKTNVTGFVRGRFSYLSTTQTNAVTVSGISIGYAK